MRVENVDNMIKRKVELFISSRSRLDPFWWNLIWSFQSICFLSFSIFDLFCHLAFDDTYSLLLTAGDTTEWMYRNTNGDPPHLRGIFFIYFPFYYKFIKSPDKVEYRPVILRRLDRVNLNYRVVIEYSYLNRFSKVCRTFLIKSFFIKGEVLIDRT